MIFIVNIFVGILVVAGTAILFWTFAWILKLLGMAFRYVMPHSGTAKIKSWLASQGWISELRDALLLLVVIVIALFTLFALGQLVTGKPFVIG